jgi:putative protease
MKCEVLAPAGSPDALCAAVRCGADAVYLGAGRFNARRNAHNFDGGALAEAVKYCHARGVKVHFTLNTLVSDGEMADALSELRYACECGIDAVIVQDIGLASLIRSAAPQVELHASTQMSVHSASALYVLKEAGFTRAVLARELSRDEIAEICREAEKIGMETEVFVHGALCMSLSGQCCMSSVIGRRSGNRGLCAQPCRLKFANGEYPLSLRDLSLLDHVGELERMGVTSLKIEGRMKRPEYVAAAVSAFRAAVDGEEISGELRSMLGGVFSRSGHTDGYFTARLGADMFGRRTDDDALASAEMLGKIHQLYRAERQSVPVGMTLRICEGEPIEMTVTDGINTVCAAGDIAPKAVSVPIEETRVRQMCAKLGSTPYYLDKFDCVIEGSPAVSAASVNALRRQLCERLTQAREGGPKPFVMPELPAPHRESGKNPRIFARFERADQIPGGISSVDRIYLPAGRGFSQPEGLHGAELGVEVPRALFAGEDKVLAMLCDARDKGARYALCHNIAAVALAKRAGLKIHAGFGMNVFNSVSAELLKDCDVTLSFELTLAAARSVSRGGLFAYGRIPLMLTRNCPMGGAHKCGGCTHTLCDRKNERFAVLCRGGYSEIYNSKPLVLSRTEDRLDGFDFLMLYFTDESAARCAEVIEHYTDGTPLAGDFTHGLYYRGAL